MARAPLQSPAPTAVDVLAQDEQYRGGEWVMVDLDLSRIANMPRL